MSALLDYARFELQQRSHHIQVLPVIIVYLNNICDSRCVTCSIWKNNELLKIPAERQMADDLLEELYQGLGKWHPRQILLSGGEPALHPAFPEAVRRFREVAGKVCVITNGLTLSSRDAGTLQSVAEFYISFDAPDRESYLNIRGVDGFERLAATLKVLKGLQTRPKVVARCTLQKANVGRLQELVAAARRFGFDCISFLGADLTSAAFAREMHGPAETASIQPDANDLFAMESEIEALSVSDRDFIEGGAERLTRIVQYFRGLLGESEFPPVRCNAPWFSMVVETTGKVRGCFFQPVIGDVHSINGEEAVHFRHQLNVNTDSTCSRCVCSKFVGSRDFMLL